MDPRERADAMLSRARARGAFVVTPDNAVSPMDASNTQQIPRSVVADADVRAVDPDATAVVSDDDIRQHDARTNYLADREPTSQLGSAAEQVGSATAQTPPVAPPADPESEMETVELDGLIPTTTQRTRSTLSRRLDG
ncbi:MAG: hypothetical protein ACRDQW_09275 [Haloechinothrix sp.]